MPASPETPPFNPVRFRSNLVEYSGLTLHPPVNHSPVFRLTQRSAAIGREGRMRTRQRPVSRRPRQAVLAAVFFAMIAAPTMAIDTAFAQTAKDLAGRGKELAERHCSRCHVVNPDNRLAGISSTPSFMILIKALDDWQDRFATFHARLPHPAHIRFESDEPRPRNLPATIEAEVILKTEDIDAIVAYARELSDLVKE